MKFFKKILLNIIIPLLFFIIPLFFSYWINITSGGPVIEIDSSNVYSTIDGLPIGYVFIGNSGKTVDTNISITIDTIIDKDKISLPSFVSDYKVDYVGNNTVITLFSLRPNEQVRMFFSPKEYNGSSQFEIINTLSDSGNIYDLQYVEWRNVSYEAKIFYFISIISTFFGGIYVLYMLTKKD